jgi:hypothetical protein
MAAEVARLYRIVCLALAAASLAGAEEPAGSKPAVPVAEAAGNASPQLIFSGVGWVQYGQIGNSSDTTVRNYNGNSTQNSGAQISVAAKINDRFTGAVGLGVFEGHALAGPISGGGRVPISSSPYIAEARFTYRIGEESAPLFQMTAGLFPYNYNPNIKDLGLYLLRGPVYPGILISGFETKEVLPISNILGLWFRNTHGAFTHDLLFVSETEVKPYFDISLAYIGKAKVSEALTLGAGVNLYHLIPSDGKVSHDPYDPVKETREQDVHNPYQRQFIYVDSNGTRADTTYFGFDGTKLMANLEFDPKPLIGSSDAFGPEDLKLYSEAAVLGLSFDKAHKAIYGPLSKRMPIMVGFNFPTFRLLDHLSLEAEWYGAEFRDDLYRLEPDQDRPVSPIPFSVNDTLKVYTRDNVKWALHAAKTIEGHFKISAQVANDHFRPNGTVNPPATYHAAFSTLSDWYWMAKIAYFF